MTLYINCDDNPITFNKKNYLLRAAKRLGLVDVKDYREKHKDTPEYILNIEPCTIMTGAKWTGLWHIDVLLNNDKYAGAYPNMDKVYVSSNQGKYPLENTNVLFQACDSELHRRDEKIEQEYDFVICGSNGGDIWNKREKAFKDLKDEGFKYYDYAKDNKPEVYVQNINHAKVQFIRTGEGDQGNGAVAQRFFECLAIGPVLTNYTHDIPLLGLVEGEDFMTYKTEHEMIYKMKLLIESETLRREIAKNGRQKALHYHSYEGRLVAVMNDINDFISTTQ